MYCIWQDTQEEKDDYRAREEDGGDWGKQEGQEQEVWDDLSWDPTWTDSQPPHDWTTPKVLEEVEEEQPQEEDADFDMQEEFLKRVEADPELPISREKAREAFHYMVNKLEQLGLELSPEEMSGQLTVGCVRHGSAEDLQVIEDPEKKGFEKEKNEDPEKKGLEKEEKEDPEKKGLEKEEKKGLEKEEKEDPEKKGSAKEEKEDVEKNNLQQDEKKEDEQFKNSVEEIHEDWDSSEASTRNKWSDQSDSPSLEQKLEECPEKDHYRVALMHEINQEKKERRDTKKAEKRKAEETLEEAGLSWFPITKQGFNDFMLHCQGEKPVIQAHPQPLDLPAPAKNAKLVKWGPVTKKGLTNFMAKTGQVKLKPNVSEMGLAELVDYALRVDLDNLDQSIPDIIAQSLKYIVDLHTLWGVVDIEDFDWWLSDGWGPLWFNYSPNPSLDLPLSSRPLISLHSGTITTRTPRENLWKSQRSTQMKSKRQRDLKNAQCPGC